MVKFKDFSRPLGVFQVLFKPNLKTKQILKTVLYIQVFFKPVRTLQVNTRIKITHDCFIAFTCTRSLQRCLKTRLVHVHFTGLVFPDSLGPSRCKCMKTCLIPRGQKYFNIALVLQDELLTIFTRPANTCACPLKAYAMKKMSISNAY